MADNTGNAAESRSVSSASSRGGRSFWEQGEAGHAGVPRVSPAAGAAALLGWAAGAVASAAALAVLVLDSKADWPARAIWAALCLAGGWGLAAGLWAMRGILQQQYKLLRRQQRILDLLGAGMFPTIMEVDDTVPLADPADGPPALPADAAAGTEGQAVSPMIERVLRELAEIRADMLLTPEQLERKRADVRRREQEETWRRVDECLAAGNLAQAQSLLRTYVVTFGEDATAGRLRHRLAEAMAERIEPALAAGELSQAQRWIARLAEIGAEDSRLAAYEQRLAQWLVDDVDRLLNAHDLATAGSMLEHLVESFPDDPRCVQLRKRLAAVRASLADGEIQAQRQRIEEWMALAHYDQAQEEAQELALRFPDNKEVADLLAGVLREASTWRADRRQSLYKQILRCAENKQWLAARDAALQLVGQFPDCDEARDTRAMLDLLSENAKIEQVRALRDELTDMVRRRRYAEAVLIARDVIDRFPDTQAAIELRAQLPGLMARAASGEGHPL